MPGSVRVAAHLIVGAAEERFLPAAVASVEGVADVLLVNDNSQLSDSPNMRVIRASSYGQTNSLYVDTAPFRDFGDARNRVLALHRQYAPDAWGMYLDSDQVHRRPARRIASRLDRLPRTIAIVDAYERHFLQSFDWFTEIGRHVLFFRVTPELRWELPIHERLVGVEGSRLAIPYVLDHYGALLEVQEHASKGRFYSSLGAPGLTSDEQAAKSISASQYFSPLLKRAIRYRGRPPEALRMLDPDVRKRFAQSPATDRLIETAQSTTQRLRNCYWVFTYGYRWRARALDPRAFRLVTPW